MCYWTLVNQTQKIPIKSLRAAASHDQDSLAKEIFNLNEFPGKIEKN